MNYLVDTHVFLWTLTSPKNLSKATKDILLDTQSTKYVSAITFWEISLKFSLGKLDLNNITPNQLVSTAEKSGFETLPLDANTASSFHMLKKIPNKDPFDRMLAWQAITEKYTLITKDKDFAAYKYLGLKTIW